MRPLEFFGEARFEAYLAYASLAMWAPSNTRFEDLTKEELLAIIGWNKACEELKEEAAK